MLRIGHGAAGTPQQRRGGLLDSRSGSGAAGILPAVHALGRAAPLVSCSSSSSSSQRVQWLPAGIGKGNRLDVAARAHADIPTAKGATASVATCHPLPNWTSLLVHPILIIAPVNAPALPRPVLQGCSTLRTTRMHAVSASWAS